MVAGAPPVPRAMVTSEVVCPPAPVVLVPGFARMGTQMVSAASVCKRRQLQDAMIGKRNGNWTRLHSVSQACRRC